MVKAWADGVRIYYIKVRASALCRCSFVKRRLNLTMLTSQQYVFADLGRFTTPRGLYSHTPNTQLEYVYSAAKLQKFAKKKNG